MVFRKLENVKQTDLNAIPSTPKKKTMHNFDHRLSQSSHMEISNSLIRAYSDPLIQKMMAI